MNAFADNVASAAGAIAWQAKQRCSFRRHAIFERLWIEFPPADVAAGKREPEPLLVFRKPVHVILSVRFGCGAKLLFAVNGEQVPGEQGAENKDLHESDDRIHRRWPNV